jgi:hypothetical protein
MFGQDNQSDQSSAAIPDQSIDGALADPQAPAQSDWQHPGQPLNDNSAATPAAPVSDDLVSLKQEALNHLAPLIDHLDQNAEEKFRTIMMMIQASDDQSKLKDALAAAQSIPDEKARAQALLDVINEINYFSQPPSAE